LQEYHNALEKLNFHEVKLVLPFNSLIHIMIKHMKFFFYCSINPFDPLRNSIPLGAFGLLGSYSFGISPVFFLKYLDDILDLRIFKFLYYVLFLYLIIDFGILKK